MRGSYAPYPFAYAMTVQSVRYSKHEIWITLETEREPLYIKVFCRDSQTMGVCAGLRTGQRPGIDLTEPGTAIDFAVTIEDEPEQIRMLTSAMQVTIRKNPYGMTVRDARGRVVLAEHFDDKNPVGEGEDQVPPLGYHFDGQEPETALAMNLNFALGHDEHIYGLGERFTNLDRQGQFVVMENWDALGARDEKSYKNIPFYMSSKGYGLFVNSTGRTEFHVGSYSTESLHICVPGDVVEYYILTGRDYGDILGRYIKLTGKPALPPAWSFGVWFSSGFAASSQKDIEADVEFFRDHNIPCDVYHFDCYWLRDDHWCDFVWDNQTYPDPESFIEKLHSLGLKVCVWVNPYVTNITDMYREGREKGLLVKNAHGEPYEADLWHGLLPPCAIVDFTNPAACDWFGDKIRRLLHMGVDVIKTDFGEDIPLDGVFHNGIKGTDMRNYYALLYNRLVFDITKEIKGEENGLVWARSGFAGMQKHPVCWSGDPKSSYGAMAATLRAGLSIGLSGVPFWSHDIGGFYGKVEPEVFVRWAQFGLFSSHSRFHGTTSRQFWLYGQRASDIITRFIRLRYRLMPYILEMAGKSACTGVPFIRPLWFMHPGDPVSQSIWDQYYFGDDIIVAPVFGGDNTERSFYLPEGEWMDLLSGEAHAGGQYHKRLCALETLPVFIKKDRYRSVYTA